MIRDMGKLRTFGLGEVRAGGEGNGIHIYLAVQRLFTEHSSYKPTKTFPLLRMKYTRQEFMPKTAILWFFDVRFLAVDARDAVCRCLFVGVQ